MAKVNSEQGWQAMQHAQAKTIPFALWHTGRARKALRHLIGAKR